MANAALLPFFQYIVSMAVYRAVSQLAGGDAREALGLRLKWPNDIYLVSAGSEAAGGAAGGSAKREKIGGVLCQSSVAIGAAAKPYRVVAGVGINVCVLVLLCACARGCGVREFPRPKTMHARSACGCTHTSMRTQTRLLACAWRIVNNKF